MIMELLDIPILLLHTMVFVSSCPTSRGIKFNPVCIERSRQSAKECRARKKLRYQYLEDLASAREKAVIALYDELEQVLLAIIG